MNRVRISEALNGIQMEYIIECESYNPVLRKRSSDKEYKMDRNEQVSAHFTKAHRNSLPKVWLIAALVATAVILMAAAIFTRWSNSMQSYYNPSEKAKEQAETNGLSIIYDATQPDDGSILSATDQGITVSVVQSVVDQSRANIILRVEGFTPPEGNGIRPYVWMNPATLDGDLHFSTNRGASFYNGVLVDMDGNDIYEDGTPVAVDENGWQIGRYVRPDGSLELMLVYLFRDTSGANLGKEIQLHLTGFGYDKNADKLEPVQEQLVEGSWDLKWVLNGTDSVKKIEPNIRLSDNATLLSVEIGQISLKAHYRTDSYWDGSASMEFFQPTIAGVKLKNGTLISFAPVNERYEDQDNMLYMVESQSFKGMVDMEQIEALAYFDHWENDADGNPTIPVYQYIPVR